MAVLIDAPRTILTGFGAGWPKVVTVSPGLVEVTLGGVSGGVIGLPSVMTIRPTAVSVIRRWPWSRAYVRFEGSRVQLLPFNGQLRRFVLALEVAGFDVALDPGRVFGSQRSERPGA
jgi:hypothetical protein